MSNKSYWDGQNGGRDDGSVNWALGDIQRQQEIQRITAIHKPTGRMFDLPDDNAKKKEIIRQPPRKLTEEERRRLARTNRLLLNTFKWVCILISIATTIAIAIALAWRLTLGVSDYIHRLGYPNTPAKMDCKHRPVLVENSLACPVYVDGHNLHHIRIAPVENWPSLRAPIFQKLYPQNPGNLRLITVASEHQKDNLARRAHIAFWEHWGVFRSKEKVRLRQDLQDKLGPRSSQMKRRAVLVCMYGKDLDRRVRYWFAPMHARLPDGFESTELSRRIEGVAATCPTVSSLR